MNNAFFIFVVNTLRQHVFFVDYSPLLVILNGDYVLYPDYFVWLHTQNVPFIYQIDRKYIDTKHLIETTLNEFGTACVILYTLNNKSIRNNAAVIHRQHTTIPEWFLNAMYKDLSNVYPTNDAPVNSSFISYFTKIFEEQQKKCHILSISGGSRGEQTFRSLILYLKAIDFKT